MKHIMRFAYILMFLLTACGPTPEEIQVMLEKTVQAFPTATMYPTYTLSPSSTPYPTPTPQPTYTAYPTQTAIVVTATYTFTPSSSPTITPTSTNTSIPSKTPKPTQTLQPTNTQNPLTRDITGSGIYVVGVDIAPGYWEYVSGGDTCFLKIYDSDMNVLSERNGMPGGALLIYPTDYQVTMMGCGTYRWVGE